ncbi:MAG TPA: NUDIX domain-containing protein [Dissulfurispiraceae bacterium]|nr:NUDIX domain-containing protein [Dissulfurispiraceae bacterium]
MAEELIEVVAPDGRVLDTVSRSAVHGNPDLLHKVVHILVFNTAGALLLQRRSMKKDVAPGRWDTSVGGHVSPGEDNMTAALREMEEELGIAAGGDLAFLYSYIHSNPYESELVHTYCTIHDGPFSFNAEEIDEVRFWLLSDLAELGDSALLSDNFRHELRSYLHHIESPLRK